MTQIIKNGALVGNPFAGDYDIKRLTTAQATEVSGVIEKSRSGKRLSIQDVNAVMQARKAARTSPPVAKGDTMEVLTRAVRDLREAFK